MAESMVLREEAGMHALEAGLRLSGLALFDDDDDGHQSALPAGSWLPPSRPAGALQWKDEDGLFSPRERDRTSLRRSLPPALVLVLPATDERPSL